MTAHTPHRPAAGRFHLEDESHGSAGTKGAAEGAASSAAPQPIEQPLGSHQGERAPGADPMASGARQTFGGVPVSSIEAVMAERAKHFTYGHTIADDLQLPPGRLAILAREKLRDGIEHAQLGTHENAVKRLVRAAAFILAELDALEARRREREG